MVTDIVISVIVKGLLALAGIWLLFSGASAISDGAEIIGPVMVIAGLILLLGLKAKAK